MFHIFRTNEDNAGTRTGVSGAHPPPGGASGTRRERGGGNVNAGRGGVVHRAVKFACHLGKGVLDPRIT